MALQKNVICFGEMLWDVLPTGKVAGGAPMNVAIRLQSLGIAAKIISRIGKDEPGNELSAILQARKVAISLVQHDEKLPTGEVIVRLTEQGIPSYTIVHPSAWDNIQIDQAIINEVKTVDAFVFGSLACRSETSKQSLLCLLEHARYKVFDVNLRAPFYSFALLETLMYKTDLLKLNDEELSLIATNFNSPYTGLEDNAKFLAEKSGAKLICVTLGANGAFLYNGNSFYRHAGFKVNVVDTIGAGDSFLAGLLSVLLCSDDYARALDFACAVGAFVASQKGANPELPEDLSGFMAGGI